MDCCNHKLPISQYGIRMDKNLHLELTRSVEDSEEKELVHTVKQISNMILTKNTISKYIMQVKILKVMTNGL